MLFPRALRVVIAQGVFAGNAARIQETIKLETIRTRNPPVQTAAVEKASVQKPAAGSTGGIMTFG
jgi:hypothetical protein